MLCNNFIKTGFMCTVRDIRFVLLCLRWRLPHLVVEKYHPKIWQRDYNKETCHQANHTNNDDDACTDHNN